MTTMIVKDDRWLVWRGSPDLLAQIVRVAIRCAESNASVPTSCTIDVAVAKDHEVFSSPSEFIGEVTPDALRRFKRIDVEIASDVLQVHFRMVHLRNWWASGKGPDAEVSLRVVAPEKAATKAFGTILASVERGRTTRSETRQTLIGFSVSYLATTTVLAAVFSAFYLLKLPERAVVPIAIGAPLIAVAAGYFATAWIYPTIEVATPGQTHVARLVRFAGPLLAGFILTGVGKALYG
jgi:hypothetical protein